MYVVNVYLPEQSSLCLSSVGVSVLGAVPGGVQLRAPPALGLQGVWVPLARATSLALLAWRPWRGPAHLGDFPGFPYTFVWFPVHVHIIISNQATFTYVRIIIYSVLSLIIPLSVSCTSQNLHNNQTSKPEPFTGRKVFPLYYFNKINYNDQLNLNLHFRFFPVNPLKWELKANFKFSNKNLTQ